LTKCTPNEFVPSIIVDGLLMEKNLGVLNFFRTNSTDSYIPGLKGGALFLHKFFQQIYASAGLYEFVLRIRTINTRNSC
jgi:hypothetical protein